MLIFMLSSTCLFNHRTIQRDEHVINVWIILSHSTLTTQMAVLTASVLTGQNNVPRQTMYGEL